MNKVLTAFLLVLLVAIIVSGAWFLDRRMEERMASLKEAAVGHLEAALGRRIRYGSMSPSIFGFLAVRDLQIFSFEDPGNILLQISRLKIHYRVLDLLLQRDLVRALSEIHVAHSVFTVDLDRDRELLELLGRLTGTASAGSVPTPAVRLGGSNILLNLRSGGQQLSLSKLFFTVDTSTGGPEAGAYRLSFRTLADLTGIGPGGQALKASSRVRISGRVGRDLSWSDLALRVYSLSTDTFTLRRQTFQVTLQDRKLDVHKVQDRAPLDLHLSMHLDTRAVELQVKSQDFRPSSMLSFSGLLSRFDSLLRSPLTLSGRVTTSLGTDDLRYELNVRTQAGDRLLPVDLRVNARLHGDRSIVHFHPLSLESDRGSLEFVGNILLRNFHPQGLVKLVEVQAFSGESLSAALELVRQGQTVRVSGERLSFGPLELGGVDLRLTPVPQGLRYSLAASLGDGAPREAPSPGVRSEGELRVRPRLELQADCSLEGLPLEVVRDFMLPTIELPGEIQSLVRAARLSAELRVSTDFDRFSLEAPWLHVVDVEHPGRRLQVSGQADNHNVQVDRYSLEWAGYELGGTLQAGLAPGSPVNLSTAFDVKGIPYSLEARLQPGQYLVLNGSHGLSGWMAFNRASFSKLVSLGAVTPRNLGGVRGITLNLQLEDLPVPLPRQDGVVRVSTHLNGSISADGRLSLDSPRSVVRDLPLFSSRQNRLETAFKLEGDRCTLSKTVFADTISTLQGGGQITFASLTAFTGALQLNASEGQEQYILSLSQGDGQVRSRLQFRQAPLQRFGEFLVTGRLSGEADLEGPLVRPRVAGSLTLREGRINEDPVGLSLSFEALPETVNLSDLKLSYRTHRLLDGTGRLDTRSGDFELWTRYAGDFSTRKVSLEARLDGSLADPDGEEPFELKLDRPLTETELRAFLAFEGIRVDDRTFNPWGLQFGAEGGRLSFLGGPAGNSIRGEVSGDGGFHLSLSAPLPIRGEAAGRLEGRQIQSTFSVTQLDMKVIDSLSRTDMFHFTAGTGQGQLQINGAVNDPDFFGRLQVRGGGMDFAMSPDPVGPFDGTLLFNGKTFTLQRTIAPAGQARVAALGNFTIDHWVPNAFDLGFTVAEKQGLKMRYRFGPIFADGLVWGSVQVRGDGAGLEVEGKLLVDRCQIAIDNEAAPAPAGEAAPLTVKMDIATGKRVEFFWPSINFPIVRTFARQGERVSIFSDAVGDTFTMNGRVEIRGGEIFYFDRSFYMKEGKITFRETGAEVDPRIEALAELRERDQNNEEIRIYLEADNRLSQFSPRFYSTPSRSNAEILGLIGGSIAERMEGSTFGSAVLLTTDLVSQFYILRPFEQAVRELLGLDMFTIRTQMVQNVLIGKLMGEKSPGELLNPLDNTTLSLGKYLGTDLFLEMLLRFQATDVASAQFPAGRQIRTEGEIAFEWQTPFFMLEWRFTPRHPETLFLTDNSLGLSWGFSY